MVELNGKKILVTFLMHLGDLTLTTPFIHALRKAAPDARITMLVDEKLKDVVLFNPYLEKFPIPYVLTNCHNSLCAVGGTINEDDHMFGLTCAKKYGGVYVPPHQAVIHQFAREMLAGGGRMILGSDSHTRYGALGTMAMGEGGPELVKQLLSKTYDINMPEVIGIYLTGAPVPGVGPQDVALDILGELFGNGYVKNKVMEFVGPGVSNLSADFRIGVDVMTLFFT